VDSPPFLLSFFLILFCCQVNVLKPSHKSTLESKIAETPVPDSVSAIHNITNPTRDVDSEFEGGHEGKIREIVMDNMDQGSTVWQIAIFFNRCRDSQILLLYCCFGFASLRL